MTARLVIQRGPIPNQQHELHGQLMNIGRSADNEIVVNDAEVSRRHARILHRQDEDRSHYLLEDLGSTNGTFVNGLRCSTLTPLADGDVIELGDSIRMVFMPAAADVVKTAVNESDYDTADLPPLSDAPPRLAAYQSGSASVPETDKLIAAEPVWRSRRVLIGCGCATLLLICLCGATILFLDSYQQGRLLYCGGLQPIFEFILGPFGFSPICP